MLKIRQYNEGFNWHAKGNLTVHFEEEIYDEGFELEAKLREKGGFFNARMASIHDKKIYRDVKISRYNEEENKNRKDIILVDLPTKGEKRWKITDSEGARWHALTRKSPLATNYFVVGGLSPANALKKRQGLHMGENIKATLPSTLGDTTALALLEKGANRTAIMHGIFGVFSVLLPERIRPNAIEKKPAPGEERLLRVENEHEVEPSELRFDLTRKQAAALWLAGAIAVSACLLLFFSPIAIFPVAIMSSWLLAGPVIAGAVILFPVIVSSLTYILKSGGVISRLVGALSGVKGLQKFGDWIYGEAPVRNFAWQTAFVIASVIIGFLNQFAKILNTRASSDEISIDNPSNAVSLKIGLYAARLLSNWGRVASATIVATIGIIAVVSLFGGPTAIPGILGVLSFITNNIAFGYLIPVNMLLGYLGIATIPVAAIVPALSTLAMSSLSSLILIGIASFIGFTILVYPIFKGLAKFFIDVYYDVKYSKADQPNAEENVRASMLTNSQVDEAERLNRPINSSFIQNAEKIEINRRKLWRAGEITFWQMFSRESTIRRILANKAMLQEEAAEDQKLPEQSEVFV